jgi:hypothetical protein
MAKQFKGEPLEMRPEGPLEDIQVEQEEREMLIFEKWPGRWRIRLTTRYPHLTIAMLFIGAIMGALALHYLSKLLH